MGWWEVRQKRQQQQLLAAAASATAAAAAAAAAAPAPAPAAAAAAVVKHGLSRQKLHGIALWSSDIACSWTEFRAQVFHSFFFTPCAFP